MKKGFIGAKGLFGGGVSPSDIVENLGVAISLVGVDIESGPSKSYFDFPYNFYVSEVQGTLKVAPTGSSAIFDVNVDGATILTNKITIDSGEVSSLTATIQPSLSSNTFAKGQRVTFDIDQKGAADSGQEGIVYLIGYKL